MQHIREGGVKLILESNKNMQLSKDKEIKLFEEDNEEKRAEEIERERKKSEL